VVRTVAEPSVAATTVALLAVERMGVVTAAAAKTVAESPMAEPSVAATTVALLAVERMGVVTAAEAKTVAESPMAEQ